MNQNTLTDDIVVKTRTLERMILTSLTQVPLDVLEPRASAVMAHDCDALVARLQAYVWAEEIQSDTATAHGRVAGVHLAGLQGSLVLALGAATLAGEARRANLGVQVHGQGEAARVSLCAAAEHGAVRAARGDRRIGSAVPGRQKAGRRMKVREALARASLDVSGDILRKFVADIRGSDGKSAMLAALVMAAGGRIKVTAQQVALAVDKEYRLYVEDHPEPTAPAGPDWTVTITAKPKPRCEHCHQVVPEKVYDE